MYERRQRNIIPPTVVGTFGEKVVWMIEAWEVQGWDQAVGTPAQDKGQG